MVEINIVRFFIMLPILLMIFFIMGLWFGKKLGRQGYIPWRGLKCTHGASLFEPCRPCYTMNGSKRTVWADDVGLIEILKE